jgi:hypothetical protein
MRRNQTDSIYSIAEDQMNAGPTKPTPLKKPGTDVVKPSPSAEGQARPHSITDSGDVAALRRDIKEIYLNKVGANVLAGQMRLFVSHTGDESGQVARKGAETFVAAIMESVQPRDAIEEMLALQIFRKQMLALAEYRRPPRTDSFVTIKQANVAQQQVIHHDQNQNPAKPVTSNELGSAPT